MSQQDYKEGSDSSSNDSTLTNSLASLDSSTSVTPTQTGLKEHDARVANWTARESNSSLTLPGNCLVVSGHRVTVPAVFSVSKTSGDLGGKVSQCRFVFTDVALRHGGATASAVDYPFEILSTGDGLMTWSSGGPDGWKVDYPDGEADSRHCISLTKTTSGRDRGFVPGTPVLSRQLDSIGPRSIESIIFFPLDMLDSEDAAVRVARSRLSGKVAEGGESWYGRLEFHLSPDLKKGF